MGNQCSFNSSQLYKLTELKDTKFNIMKDQSNHVIYSIKNRL